MCIIIHSTHACASPRVTLPTLVRAQCNAHLGSEPLQEAVKQHLFVQDLKQGVVQKQPLPPGALHKLINDDGDDQVQHDEIDAKDEGDAVDG